MIKLKCVGGILYLSTDPTALRRTLPFSQAWREDWWRLGPGEAEELLRGTLSPGALDALLRDALAGPNGDGASTARADREELIRRASRLLAHGWAVKITYAEQPGGIPPSNQSDAPPPIEDAVPPEQNPTGVPKQKEKDHWIVVELVGENGEPIPSELCRVTTPDGDVIERETDIQGKVEVRQISAGDCMVEFPELDKDAWEPTSGDGAA